MYCSDACKLKAYRARKKELVEARRNTLTFDEHAVYSSLIYLIGDGRDMQQIVDALIATHKRDQWQLVLQALFDIAYTAVTIERGRAFSRSKELVP